MPAARSFEDGRADAHLGQLRSTPTWLSVNGAVELSSGSYEVVSNVAAFIRQVGSNVSVDAANAHLLPVGAIRTFAVGGSNDSWLSYYADSNIAGACVSKR